jgi:hypothetical protein
MPICKEQHVAVRALTGLLLLVDALMDARLHVIVVKLMFVHAHLTLHKSSLTVQLIIQISIALSKEDSHDDYRHCSCRIATRMLVHARPNYTSIPHWIPSFPSLACVLVSSLHAKL